MNKNKKFFAHFLRNLIFGTLGFILFFAIVKTQFFKAEESSAQVVGPVCQIFAPDSATVGQPVNFSVNAFATPGRTIQFSEWDFGTGTPIGGQLENAPSITRNQSFTFNVAQNPTVIFKFIDTMGTFTCRKTIVIIGAANAENPVCRNLTAIVNGPHVDLIADCVPGILPISNYSFNFGANTGNPVTSFTNTLGFTHTVAPGTPFKASAFARDGQGRQSNPVFAQYTITSLTPVNPIFPTPPPPGCPFALFAAIRNAATNDTFGTNKLTTAGQPIQVRAFRDANFLTPDDTILMTVTGPVGFNAQSIQSGGTFTANLPGDYTIRAIFGACSSNPATLNIIGGGGINKPVCTLSHQVSGMTVFVTNNATNPLGFPINQFFFDFGDGFGAQFSPTSTTSHTYPVTAGTGPFTVSSFVIDTQQNQSDRCQTPQFFISQNPFPTPFPGNCPPGFTPVFSGNTFTCVPINQFPVPTPFPIFFPIPTPFPGFFPNPQQNGINQSQQQTAIGGSASANSHTDPITIRVD